MENGNKDAKSQHAKAGVRGLQLQTLSFYGDADRSHEEGLNAIRTWEESTISWIQREKALREEHSSTLEDGSKEKLDTWFTDLTWEHMNMRHFQREKTRRLEHLSSCCDFIRNHEEDLKAIRVWEDATLGRVQHEKTRRREHFSSLEAQTDEDKLDNFFAELLWETPLMRRLQREKTRKLSCLSLLEHQPKTVSRDERTRQAAHAEK